MDLVNRFYDPGIGRFMQIDPVTETQENYSTYQYGWNNPILQSDPNGDCPDCPEDPFLIGKLVTTAFFDTKHAIINTAARAFGSDIRAGYKVEGGQQVFETEISRQPVDNSLEGVVNEVVNTVADVALVATAGTGSGEAASLLAKTGTGNQVVKAGKEIVAETSGAARRQAMRDAGIPTSQPLMRDKATKSSDKVFLTRDGKSTVQNAKNDISHQGQPHWEAGPTKRNVNSPDGLNRSGSNNKPQMGKPKSKVYYNE